VQTVHLDWYQPRDALLDHRVDAVVTRLPFSTDQLHITILYEEPRVLVVALDHRLAGRQSVTLDDIVDEPCRGCEIATRHGAPFGASIPGPTGAGHPKVHSPEPSRTG